MRALKIVTIAMGILIVAATALLAVLVIRRIAPAAHAGRTILPEPPGTRMTSLASTSQGLAILLQGGGPDRIIMLNPATLREIGRVTIQGP